jgi:chitinase
VDFEEWQGGPGGASETDVQKREALTALYKDLREKLGPEKLITAAVNADWDDGGRGVYNCFSNSMHEYLDFVSLMIYDETGPWSGNRTGPHSSWSFFENGINHWLKNRQIPREKLVAGVPFYGYIFPERGIAKGAKSMAYKNILTTYPDIEAHKTDSIGLLYYDGMPTMQRKAEYIRDHNLGGIMIWEITHDTDDPGKSLLNVIHNTFHSE